jgi:L-ascorbate metabolism protein UlaG (beta-lactamase superfamily)
MTGVSPSLVSENNGSASGAAITYLGHSTLLIEMDGVRVVTDPVFPHRIFHLHRTHPKIEFAAIRQVDAVVISHLHYDHVDVNSLRMFPRQTRIYIPFGAGSLFKSLGFVNYKEMRAGSEDHLGPVQVRATYADHNGERHPFGMRADCLGYVFSGSPSIYFPGDTRLFPEMDSIAENLDVALMPVWGWGPHLGRMHMNPHQAAEALTLLKPRLAIPIHWGTYLPTGLGWTRPNFHHNPPLEFASHARDLAPQVQVHILKPGESHAYP